jgi:sigma-B regulation protein RsbU (phosphoserine phosphatase)
VQDVVTRKISQESKIICYTDGLSELPDEFGREMGTKAVEKNIKNNNSIDVNIRDLIFEERILEDNEKLFDDVSLLGIQFYI